MPERIVEGDALLELKTLPQLVSGYSNQCKDQALNFAKFHFDKIIELSSLEEAEIIKLSSNAYRDLNFAFANEITRIASKFNLSGNKLIKIQIWVTLEIKFHFQVLVLRLLSPKRSYFIFKIYENDGYALNNIKTD